MLVPYEGEAKLKTVNEKEQQDEILEDLKLLQSCSSPNSFDLAIKLFKKKWSNSKSDKIKKSKNCTIIFLSI